MTSTPVDVKLYNRVKYHIYELYLLTPLIEVVY